MFQASRQNDIDATRDSNGDHLSNERTSDMKDGRARIVDPPRYEEVGISGFPSMVLILCFGTLFRDICF